MMEALAVLGIVLIAGALLWWGYHELAKGVKHL